MEKKIAVESGPAGRWNSCRLSPKILKQKKTEQLTVPFSKTLSIKPIFSPSHHRPVFSTVLQPGREVRFQYDLCGIYNQLQEQ
jgi:hypothetical protein